MWATVRRASALGVYMHVYVQYVYAYGSLHAQWDITIVLLLVHRRRMRTRKQRVWMNEIWLQKEECEEFHTLVK